MTINRPAAQPSKQSEQMELDQFRADTRPFGADAANKVWEIVFLPMLNGIDRAWHYVWGDSVEQTKSKYFSDK